MNKILIFGVGLIGGSIALKVKQIDSTKYIVIPKKYYLGDIFSAVILSKSGNIFFESKLYPRWIASFRTP